MIITHSNMTAIKTTYHGPTNLRGPYISVDAGMKRRLTVAYKHGMSNESNHACAAGALCAKFNWTGDMRSGGHESGFYFVFLDK